MEKSAETIGKLAGSQNQYVTNTGCGASVLTAFPGEGNKKDQFEGPYGGEKEYDSVYKYVSPNINPGAHVWVSEVPQTYAPSMEPVGHSFMPPNESKTKYIVDDPKYTYLNDNYQGYDEAIEGFGSSSNWKLLVQILLVLALVYVLYYLWENRNNLTK